MNTELFMETLPIMLKGMLGIFVVTAAIILAIVLMNRLTAKEEKHDKN